MSPVLSRSRPPTLGAPRRRAAGVVVVALVAVALVAAVRFLPQPLPTAELTVVNPHPWAAHVDVGPADGPQFPVGQVPREQTRTFMVGPAGGGVVTLRFRYHDVAVELQVERHALAAANHHVEVPEAFGLQFREAGVAPTPTVR